MSRNPTSSIGARAWLEPLEQRRLLAIAEIQDLTLGHASSGKPAYDFVVSNGIGFFTRWGVGSVGGLWTTDGVTATRVGPGPPGTFRNIIPVRAGVVGLRDGGLTAVWRSDATAAGTYVLGEVDGVHTTLGNNLALRGHFFINDDNFNAGVYETDGNTLVSRGRVLGAWGNGAEYSDGIVFNTFVHPANHALYTLDRAGVLTKYVDYATLGGYATSLANVSAGIVFLVRRNLPDNDEYSLWQTDGSAENTFRLPVSFGPVPRYVSLVGTDKQRALIQVLNRRGRWSLWISDGTAAGTRVIQPALQGTNVDVIGSTGNHTLFVVKDGSSASAPSQLWATDGTPETTKLLADLAPHPEYPGGSLSTWPTQLNRLNMPIHNGVTYFVNSDAEHGAEIWRTDGTPQGTRLAFDLVPGPGSGHPLLAGIVGNRLIFNATLDGHLGLFAVNLSRILARPLTPLAPAPSPFSNTLLSSRAQDDRLDDLDLLISSGRAGTEWN